MSNFKVGDHVRDISGHHKIWNIANPPEGTIVGLDDGGFWHIEWGNELMGPYNWEDDEIELVPDEPALPVRTRTVVEIVPGTYGRVNVREALYKSDRDNGDVSVLFSDRDGRLNTHELRTLLNASELRAAARVFVSLAEALEEQSP